MVVLMMHLMYFVKSWDLVGPTVAPVEEDIVHEENKMCLEEDLPEGGEGVKSDL
jgi:hypothetical protein